MEYKEIWKNIDNSTFSVSNCGRIKEFNKIVEIGCNKVRINKKVWDIHRLVATYFIENPENKKLVIHKDGNVKNNFYLNLCWMTQKEHAKYETMDEVNYKIVYDDTVDCEEWKIIEGFDELYSISRNGDIKNNVSNKINQKDKSELLLFSSKSDYESQYLYELRPYNREELKAKCFPS